MVGSEFGAAFDPVDGVLAEEVGGVVCLLAMGGGGD